MEDQFLPGDYDVPQPAGNYMKFQKGENRFRILTSPVLGWSWWVDPSGNVRQKNEQVQKGDKPVRVPYDREHPAVAKHFWAVVVWNYATKSLQILEITQASVQKDIKALSMNPKWGSPLKYDLVSTRTGDRLTTEYNTIPEPATELAPEIKDAFMKTKVDLDKWMRGEEAFELTPEQAKAKLDQQFPDRKPAPAKEVEEETDLPF